MDDADADAASTESNEKESKVQKSQAERLRHFLIFVLLLSAVTFLVGSQQEASHLHIEGSAAGGVRAEVEVDPTTEEQLQRRVQELDAQVRAYKAKPDIIMETDPQGLKLTKELQHVTHQLLVKRYGRHTFRVRVDLIFPDVIVQKDGLPAEDSFIIELAPIDLIPCSVYYFLEVARTWKSGAFHRNANHVLQVAVQTSGVQRQQRQQSMPFQEYSPEFPHRKGTTGYAGRPSGPAWYVSIMDNTVNHGPGSQQHHNPHEADSLFGRIVQGMDDVVPRIHSTPQTSWLDRPNQIQIPKMTIWIPNTVPSGTGETKGWVPWTAPEEGGGGTTKITTTTTTGERR